MEWSPNPPLHYHWLRVLHLLHYFIFFCSDPLEELSYSIINYGLFCTSVRTDKPNHKAHVPEFVEYQVVRHQCQVPGFLHLSSAYDVQNLQLLLVISKAEAVFTFLGIYSLRCILATVSYMILQEFFGGFRL